VVVAASEGPEVLPRGHRNEAEARFRHNTSRNAEVTPQQKQGGICCLVIFLIVFIVVVIIVTVARNRASDSCLYFSCQLCGFNCLGESRKICFGVA
jgi:hypothetical protein